MSRARAGGRREQVLAVLRDAPGPMSVVEIAERVESPPNTVRFHLEALTRSGRVERAALAGAGPGRPPFGFRIRPGMDPEGPRNYALLAQVLMAGLAGEPGAARRAVRLGRSWGGRMVAGQPEAGSVDEAVDSLVRLLDGLGFAPERRGEADRPQIGLRNCPFLEVAHESTEVVCPIHLGLMRGAMDKLTRSVAVESLQPFAEPDLCLTHLAVKEGAPSS